MRALMAFCLAACLATPAPAQTTQVDIELLLMVDVSRSMSPAELELQRRGYAEALASDDVIAAIRSGFLANVAIAYVEWAGAYSQRLVVDWQVLTGRDDALAFAEALAANYPLGMRRTSISGAIETGQRMIEENAFDGLRRVIDISGDGPNNQGGPVTEARDAAMAAGIVINGLPLMTRERTFSQYDLDDLDVYYHACVIGGPGSFVLPVYHWDAFAEAVKRKLILELVGPSRAQTQVIPAQFAARPDYDCLIGERIWDQNRGGFNLP